MRVPALSNVTLRELLDSQPGSSWDLVWALSTKEPLRGENPRAGGPVGQRR